MLPLPGAASLIGHQRVAGIVYVAGTAEAGEPEVWTIEPHVESRRDGVRDLGVEALPAGSGVQRDAYDVGRRTWDIRIDVLGGFTVTVDGVGNVIVNPRESLDATMNGVGAIFYTGSPRHVSTRMNGLGTIGQRDSSPAHDAEPKKQIDPDQLQPEYEDPDKQKAGKERVEQVDYTEDQTEVI